MPVSCFGQIESILCPRSPVVTDSGQLIRKSSYLIGKVSLARRKNLPEEGYCHHNPICIFPLESKGFALPEETHDQSSTRCSFSAFELQSLV